MFIVHLLTSIFTGSFHITPYAKQSLVLEIIFFPQKLFWRITYLNSSFEKLLSSFARTGQKIIAASSIVAEFILLFFKFLPYFGDYTRKKQTLSSRCSYRLILRYVLDQIFPLIFIHPYSCTQSRILQINFYDIFLW